VDELSATVRQLRDALQQSLEHVSPGTEEISREMEHARAQVKEAEVQLSAAIKERDDATLRERRQQGALLQMAENLEQEQSGARLLLLQLERVSAERDEALSRTGHQAEALVGVAQELGQLRRKEPGQVEEDTNAEQQPVQVEEACWKLGRSLDADTEFTEGPEGYVSTVATSEYSPCSPESWPEYIDVDLSAGKGSLGSSAALRASTS